MCRFIFIRHGKTLGNLEHRYVGSTNQPLLKSSTQELLQHDYPSVDLLYTSPMLRCLQTANILYPNLSPVIIHDLRETDFGYFENKSYQELKDLPEYQAWANSNGLLPFPQGESIEEFKQRCNNAFLNIAKQTFQLDINIGLVIHGGTIMAVLEQFSVHASTFYDWKVENGNGFQANLNNHYKLEEIKRLW